MKIVYRSGVLKFAVKSKLSKSTWCYSRNYFPSSPLQGFFLLITYPTDSSSPVFSIICSQDFKENVGISPIVSEFQETG